MKYFPLCLALAVLISPLAAMAENTDDGLYDPVAPAGSAFIRFMNADPSVKNNQAPTANGKQYEEVDYAQVSPYYPIPKGALKTTFMTASTEATLEEGKFYTQVLRAERIETIADPVTEKNPNKAQVSFYNLSVTPEVSLKTADGATAITTEPVKSGKAAARLLNAIKLNSGIFNGTTRLAAVDALALERGKAYSIVLFSDENGEPKVVTTTNSTDTTK